MPFAFPVALEVAGRRCLVVGGGRMAESKARALVEAGAEVAVLSRKPNAGLSELAVRGVLKLQGRDYATGDLAGAFLVMVACGDRGVHDAVWREAEREGVLCNVVDDPARCHFAMPALARRGDLVVAVSTGGKAPALAGHVRDRLAEELPDELGALVDLVAEIRREKLGPADLAERGRLWRRALDRDIVDLLASGRREEAAAELRRALTGALASVE